MVVVPQHNNIVKFLDDAPNRDFLHIKVYFVMGLYGCLRVSELCALMLDDIEKTSDGDLLVNKKDSKTKGRHFVVAEKFHIDLVDEYIALRPNKAETSPRRF